MVRSSHFVLSKIVKFCSGFCLPYHSEFRKEKHSEGIIPLNSKHLYIFIYSLNTCCVPNAILNVRSLWSLQCGGRYVNRHSWFLYFCDCSLTKPGFWSFSLITGASLVAQTVKKPPAMQETQVWSLGQEDPLEKGMATYSSILAWEVSWTEEPSTLPCIGSKRIGHD